MDWFNRLLVGSMPFAPKLLVGLIAKRYIAGETIRAGIQKVTDLNAQGFLATMDVLGEQVTNKKETQKPMRVYRELIQEIGKRPELRTGLSVKLTQLGLSIDKELCWENLQQLINMGRDIGLFIRIDMEDSSVTTDTLDLFERSLEIYDMIGIAIQAYLHRSENDMRRLVDLGANVRVCKGIYNEPSEIAFQDKEEIRQNFIKLGKMQLEAGHHLAIATHDQYLIDHFRTYIGNKRIPENQFEYQALLGVPIDDTLHRLADEGNTVCIYIPFGDDWYAYSSRRLKENPDIAGYIARDFFKQSPISSG